jgi:signal transduction histidine kinase
MKNWSDVAQDCPLAGVLAARLRAGREEIVRRWLDRIVARVSLDANRVFPTQDLLNHVPLLVDGIADYIEEPANEITADVPVVAKAMELGELRYNQGFDVYEILKEYEILGGILFNFLIEVVDELKEPCTHGELLACGHRLFRGIAIIQQRTTTHYLRRSDEQVNDREQRLRAFNRTLSHEFKNRIGAALGADQLLATLPDLEESRRASLIGVVSTNLKEMQNILDNLLDLARLDTNVRRQRHVRLPEAIWETVRQMREFAAARGVELSISDDLPPEEVPAAAVELCLSNYLSNAIKYSDPAKQDRWVKIDAEISNTDNDGSELIVRVVDNGVGVAETARSALFRRFFRANDESNSNIEGTGLGLSIVRETAESLGGRAWAEFTATGSVFAFSMPCRRRSEEGS